MLNMVKDNKVGEVLIVGLQNGGRLDSLNAILGEVRSHLGKYQ